MSIEVSRPGLYNDAEVQKLAEYVEQEFGRLVQVLNTGMEEVVVVKRFSEPLRPRDAMLVYADGTEWDPGDGEGFYGYENGSWVKL